MILEVCVASLDDALTAQAGGADRLELNSALTLGGLTPSLGTVNYVRREVPLPLIAMLRSREGGFDYSDGEFWSLFDDFESLLEDGVDGVAFGVLRPDRTIHLPRCRRIRDKLDGKQAVFHRAFDLTPDPFIALDQLIDLGFTRVLTSGQKPTALEGSDLLNRLLDRAKGRIEILPASGINPDNVRKLLRRVPVTQVHASLKSEVIDSSYPVDHPIRFSSRLSGSHDATDLAKVKEMRKMLDSATDMVEDDSVE